MKSLLLIPIGLLLRCYLVFAFVMVFVQKQKAKRTERKIAIASMKDARQWGV
jgi:hypothetical protein